MVLRLEDKKAIVAEIAKVALNASSAVAAEYRGLTVEQMTELRSSAKKTNVYIQVVRNTLAHRALENTRFSCMQKVLTGPLVLAFSEEDPGAAARLVRDFSKKYDKLVVKALSINEKLLGAVDIDLLADLPTREQGLSILLSVLQAPVIQFARTLRETHAKLLRTFFALKCQKEGGI